LSKPGNIVEHKEKTRQKEELSGIGSLADRF
jgi:hypothetical protein